MARWNMNLAGYNVKLGAICNLPKHCGHCVALVPCMHDEGMSVEVFIDASVYRKAFVREWGLLNSKANLPD